MTIVISHTVLMQRDDGRWGVFSYGTDLADAQRILAEREKRSVRRSQ